ncbi:MAG TPA: hypothetical protein P5246_02800, partial [Candidatus Omnitrophota bacterium]|nr:hypothetical protein [Candidatus Omnitrophota bacterium]
MPKGWNADQKKLYAIIKEKAFLKGDFILSSGKKSNYYLDCRKITLSSEGVYYTAKIFLDMLKGEAFDALVSAYKEASAKIPEVVPFGCGPGCLNGAYRTKK